MSEDGTSPAVVAGLVAACTAVGALVAKSGPTVLRWLRERAQARQADAALHATDPDAVVVRDGFRALMTDMRSRIATLEARVETLERKLDEKDAVIAAKDERLHRKNNEATVLQAEVYSLREKLAAR